MESLVLSPLGSGGHLISCIALFLKFFSSSTAIRISCFARSLTLFDPVGTVIRFLLSSAAQKRGTHLHCVRKHIGPSALLGVRATQASLNDLHTGLAVDPTKRQHHSSPSRQPLSVFLPQPPSLAFFGLSDSAKAHRNRKIRIRRSPERYPTVAGLGLPARRGPQQGQPLLNPPHARGDDSATARLRTTALTN